ncbi:MAG: O-antigen ligase family protein [Clostridia bacterium]
MIIIGTSALIAILAVVVVFISGNFDIFFNSLRNAINLSTIWGRILYAVDAVPQILTHPLGLGYYGYFFAQGSFQTGVYQVTYVHNDFLQLFLDAGWLAGVALIFVVVKSLLSKKLPLLFKMLIICISVFSLLDFNLQYILIFFLLILVLDFEDDFKKLKIKFSLPIKIALCLFAVLNIYFAMVLGCELFGFNSVSLALYPNNTRIQLEQLTEIEDVSEAKELADEIIEKNEYVAYAYNIEAMYYYSLGSFENAITYKLKEIELSKYSIDCYTDLVYILAVGVQLYEEAGYTESAEYCKAYLVIIEDMLSEVEDNTSFIAYLINDTPELELPDEYLQYITEFSS